MWQVIQIGTGTKIKIEGQATVYLESNLDDYKETGRLIDFRIVE